MAPQIIYICLILLNLVLFGYRHGKEKTGKYNMFVDLIALILMTGLVYWGGFFNPLFH
jgi:hypothetical protein